MSEVVIKVTRDQTPELMQKLDAAIGRFVRRGVGYLEGQLTTSMNAAKHGRTYPRGKKSHVASAPGESPAVDSSNLVGSLQRIFPSTLEGKVGTNVEYAVYLETGTHAVSVRGTMMGPHMGGMLARPLWGTTAKDSLPTLEKMLQDEVKAI